MEGRMILPPGPAGGLVVILTFCAYFFITGHKETAYYIALAAFGLFFAAFTIIIISAAFLSTRRRKDEVD
jgi:hypothetical protein